MGEDRMFMRGSCGQVYNRTFEGGGSLETVGFLFFETLGKHP